MQHQHFLSPSIAKITADMYPFNKLNFEFNDLYYYETNHVGVSWIMEKKWCTRVIRNICIYSDTLK
jgi:hypothetical protein